MRKPCCDRQGTNKGTWSKEEDEKLVNYIRTNGEGSWRTLPRAAGLLRCGKSCRLRWINYLRPDLKRGNFSEDEDDLIIKLHALLGNRWSLIAGRLPGRTDNEVKNYWNSHLKRKLSNMGIDPDNHRLSQFPPRSKILNGSCSTTSSGANVTASIKALNCTDDQVSSDAGSSFEEEAQNLPDLNLDLAMVIPPIPIVDEEKKQNKSAISVTLIECVTPLTLRLFS